MKYRPEIDGLRAIAIIPVILFHAGFKTFSGGYTGVDVFFVISGFLITSIIYAELDQKSFSLINFYERRSRRILPLLFFVLLTTIPLAWISLFQVDMVDYFESLISTSLFYSNFLFAFEANYFDASVELKPLLHTWSLAVEEQYYIVFPLFMILLWKFNLKKRLLTLLLVFGVLSFICAEWASFNYPEYNFYLLPSRAWELAIGAILAIAIKKSLLTKFQENSFISTTLSLLGFILILLGFFLINEDTRFPSSYGIFPTVGSALVIGFANSKNLIGKLLSLKVLVFIGLISYSAYLWHHPIFAFFKHLSSSEATFIQKIILATLIIPLSYLSWKYVENPFRNKKKFNRKFIFIFSIIGSLFFIVSGLIGVHNKGFPDRNINSKLEYLSYNPDNRELQKKWWDFTNNAKIDAKNSGWFDKSNLLPNVLIIGNSHSRDIYSSLLSSAECQINFEIALYNGEIMNFSNLKNDLYSSQEYKEAHIIMVTAHFYKEDLNHIDPMVNNFIHDNKKVILVKEPYEFNLVNSRTSADIAIQRYLRLDNKDTVKDSTLVVEINKSSFRNRNIKNDLLKNRTDVIINKLVEINDNVTSLDRNDYICDLNEQSCFVIDSKFQKFIYDSRHHSIEGAAFFGKVIDEIKWLDPVIEISKDK